MKLNTECITKNSRFWKEVNALVKEAFPPEEDLSYLFFLAIDPLCRSMGYGRRAIETLREKYPDKKQVFSCHIQVWITKSFVWMMFLIPKLLKQ